MTLPSFFWHFSQTMLDLRVPCDKVKMTERQQLMRCKQVKFFFVFEPSLLAVMSFEGSPLLIALCFLRESAKNCACQLCIV